MSRHSLKCSASSSVAVSQLRPTASRKFSHSPNAYAYFFHVSGDRARIRREVKNALTRMSGRPSGPSRNG